MKFEKPESWALKRLQRKKVNDQRQTVHCCKRKASRSFSYPIETSAIIVLSFVFSTTESDAGCRMSGTNVLL